MRNLATGLICMSLGIGPNFLTAQPVNFIDRYSSTLASGYTASGATLSVASASGLPSGTSYYFVIVRAEGANTEEVFLVTSRTSTTLTVTGAQAGTSASNHASGAVIVGAIMTATAFGEFVQKGGTNTGEASMTLDMSASTTTNAQKVPVKAGATTTANGAIAYDSTADMLHAGQASADAKVPQFTATPANNDCAKWAVSGSKYKLDTTGSPCGSGSSAFSLIEQHAASASASLDFTTCISSTYDTYEITLVNLVLSQTSQTALNFRASTDGGSTYDSGNNYNWTRYAVGAVGSAGGTGATSVSIITLNDENTLTAASNYSINATYRLYNPGGALFKVITGQSSTQGTVSAVQETQIMTGLYKSTTAVNAFQILPAAGTISSGTARCYGIAK